MVESNEGRGLEWLLVCRGISVKLHLLAWLLLFCKDTSNNKAGKITFVPRYYLRQTRIFRFPNWYCAKKLFIRFVLIDTVQLFIVRHRCFCYVLCFWKGFDRLVLKWSLLVIRTGMGWPAFTVLLRWGLYKHRCWNYSLGIYYMFVNLHVVYHYCRLDFHLSLLTNRLNDHSIISHHFTQCLLYH